MVKKMKKKCCNKIMQYKILTVMRNKLTVKNKSKTRFSRIMIKNKLQIIYKVKIQMKKINKTLQMMKKKTLVMA